MPKYRVDLLVSVVVEADSHEEAEALAEKAALKKLGEVKHALEVQEVLETDPGETAENA